MKQLFLVLLFSSTLLSAQQNTTAAQGSVLSNPNGREQFRDTLTAPPTIVLDSVTRSNKDKAAVAQRKKNTLRKKRVFRKIPIDTVSFITNYKIFYEDRRTSYVDTTLSISKDYRFNFLRQDYFELLPLQNVGEGYNVLGYDFLHRKIGPQFGPTIYNYGYFEQEDIPYYQVPTPLTELFFKTTFKQGQLVDALVSVNTSPNFNFSVSYKGLRSLGNYNSSRTNGGQFRGTVHFTSSNERYRLRAHFASQTIERQVNGGLNPDSVYFFEEAPNYAEVNPDGTAVVDENGEIVKVFYDGFLDRSRLAGQMRGSTTLSGKRTYISQRYQVNNTANDSTSSVWTINNRFTYETKHYSFSSQRPSDFLGTTSLEADISDRSQLQRFENKAFVGFQHPVLGQFEGGLHYHWWKYFFEEDEYDNAPDDSGITTGQLSLFLGWEKQARGWRIKLSSYQSLLQDFASNDIYGEAEKIFFNRLGVKGMFNLRSQAPNFNMVRLKSDYDDYNWNKELKNQKWQTLGLKIHDSKWGTLEGQFSRISNYSFFNTTTILKDWGEELTAEVFQTEDVLHYLKLRFIQNLQWRGIQLVNTVQFQETKQQRAAAAEETTLADPLTLNVPKWITRTTLTGQIPLFKDALLIQPGITFQFFTDFWANSVHPLLGEMVIQNNTLIGEFPRADLFLNARIQQTRVFLKWEHFNSPYTGYDFYATPFHPYRDASIRFGVVWNFFQ